MFIYSKNEKKTILPVIKIVSLSPIKKIIVLFLYIFAEFFTGFVL